MDIGEKPYNPLMSADPHELTNLLHDWGAGRDQALHELIPRVERELNRIARRCLGQEPATCSVSASALVNEAFLRLVELRRITWQDRTHFLAMCARLMRRVLVDLARTRHAQKRGGNLIRITFDEAVIAPQDRSEDLLGLDEALEALAAVDARKGQVVELRFFAGLTLEEIAAVLGVSSKTVLRDWEFSKAWLRREMAGSRDDA